MTRRLWWRVEEIGPLAEHAAVTPRQRKTRQQYRAAWLDVPALIWSRGRDGDGVLSLNAVHLDGRCTLLDLLRLARQHDVPWLGVNADRASKDSNERSLLSHSRMDLLPPDGSWVSATVTSGTVGGGYYSALVADAYTALLCRFLRDEVECMADHLHGLSIGDMPNEHPVLHPGASLVQWEEDTGEDSSRWIEEDQVPADVDDHYTIGAYQWRWTPATIIEAQP